MTTRRPRAKHPNQETRNRVIAAVSCGLPTRLIAQVADISPATLHLHYQDELDNGHWLASARIRQTL
jgi:hypothetical protein